MIVMILILAGVSTGLLQNNGVRVVPIHKVTDKEIQPYVDAVYYFSDGRLHEEGLKLRFRDRSQMWKNSVAGTCYYWLNEIDINKNAWDYLAKKDRFLLIAHEMYHCVCNKGHDERIYADGCPSYMGTHMANKTCVDAHFKDYLNEIYKGCDL